jgi:hypothetical protein
VPQIVGVDAPSHASERNTGSISAAVCSPHRGGCGGVDSRRAVSRSPSSCHAVSVRFLNGPLFVLIRGLTPTGPSSLRQLGRLLSREARRLAASLRKRRMTEVPKRDAEQVVLLGRSALVGFPNFARHAPRAFVMPLFAPRRRIQRHERQERHPLIPRCRRS